MVGELMALADELEATNPELLAELVRRLREIRLSVESNKKLVSIS